MHLPELPVGRNDRRRLGVIDMREEATPQFVHRLILLSGIEERCLTGRDTLGFLHFVSDELVFLTVRIGRQAILANRQGVDHGSMWGAFHGLKERSQEGCELSTRALTVAGSEFA